MQIYLNKSGQQEGPYSSQDILTQFQAGTINPGDLAWHEGLAEWVPASTLAGLLFPPPPPLSPPPLPPQQGDATGGLIPYKNPHALIAYYLGIIGLFPVVGFFLAIPAIILGISGLRKRKRNPVIKGSIHAWIGIVLGLISVGYHVLVLALILFSLRAH